MAAAARLAPQNSQPKGLRGRLVTINAPAAAHANVCSTVAVQSSVFKPEVSTVRFIQCITTVTVPSATASPAAPQAIRTAPRQNVMGQA